ncbi:MAG: lipid A biosynthesis acyltransferase [Phycisphaerales bacterium]|nr:lipid A biosynthesis acyltransferase [Phycisphaerales bacterium]
MQGWYKELLEQITTPLFWFGLFAQGLFFLRFIWQWIVSEQRKQSTIPILFWYFSLLGGVAMFIYGCLRKDLVIMLGQVMATVIYTRNLMLIYNEMARSREAGLSAPDARFSKNDTNKSAE